MPFVLADPDSVPEEEMTDDIRAMIESFQYLAPPAFGGPPHSVYVAVRPGDVKHSDDQTDCLLDAETRAQLASGMTALGAIRAYIRYDGGHDEGFAYFKHCVYKDGSVRTAERVASELEATNAKDFADASRMLDELANDWAVQLLGQGYGTGEYQMYGSFWVDLDTGLLTDDPQATPRSC